MAEAREQDTGMDMIPGYERPTRSAVVDTAEQNVTYFSETESNFYECMLAESDFIFVLKILQKFKFFNPRWQTYCTFEDIIFGRKLAADSPVSVQFYLKMYLGTARHD